MTEQLMILQSVAFICASIIILIACLGLWRYGDEVSNILYARIHMNGVIDIVCIVLMFILGYPLVGLAYFVLMPVANHAIANARFYMKVEEPEE